MTVKIYISNHCRACAEAVHYFQEKGIDLELVDVTYNQERFDEMFDLGGIATPLIVIEDHILYTFDRLKIEILLEESV